MSTKKQKKISKNLAKKPAINSLAQSSIFWRPDYLRPSEWLEHLPFLFWLIEAHQPRKAVSLGATSDVAHFALCQAIKHLRLKASCYLSIDVQNETSDGINYECQDYNSQYYNTFSYILESSMSDVASQFSDGSIDLLLFIPTDEHDLESTVAHWKSKLSPRSIVLVPGISKKNPGCETFRIFELLKEEYTNFSLYYGEGLGVISIGDEISSTLINLFDRDENNSSWQVVRDNFARLGQTYIDVLQAKKYQQKVKSLEINLLSKKDKLKKLSAEYAGVNAELNLQRKELTDFSQRIKQRELEVEQNFKNLEIEKNNLNSQIRQKDKELVEKDIALKVRFEELATLTQLLEKMRKQATEQQELQKDRHLKSAESVHKLEKNITSLESQLKTHESNLEQMRKAKHDSDKVNTELNSRYKEIEQDLKLVKNERDNLNQEKKLLQAKIQSLRDDLLEEKKSVDERFRELSLLTSLLEEKELQIKELRKKNLDPDGKAILTNNLTFNERTFSVAKILGKGLKQKHRQRKELQKIIKSGFFNEEWYLRNYPDVACNEDAARDPALHYLKHGAFEGRNPGPGFDSQWYLDTNLDVKDSGFNPLLHYISMGRKEGREPLPY
ncbi:hypothetical protein [Microbulbifer sp. JMSA002]|uniref:hypothetical protein n=1 Tax=Microbulbifer sp. JMSA002 TaxID=3243368 RepID=UPI00403917AA